MDKWSNAAMARLVELQSAEEPVGGIQVFSAATRQIPLANMKVTTKISIDLTRPNIGTSVDAMQGDGNTRYVEASLLSGGRPWEPPDGVEIAVVYNKPDDTRGMYNKLPDGTPAVTVEGNVVTIILAPQMLTVPGIVRVGIVINNDSLDQLTTFPFDLSVARNQFAGAQISEDYIRLEWLETKLDEYLQKAADSGAFKGDPFTYEDFTPAQLAALQGPAGKSAYQYAVEGGYTGTEEEFSALVAYDSRKQIELIKDTMIRLHEGVNNDASGTVIAMSDASDGPLQGLRIYGRTTQDGTPTPDNPVPLVSVGDGGSVGVTVAGKNLVTGITNGNSANNYVAALYAKVDTLLPDTDYFISFTGASGNKCYSNENLFNYAVFTCTGSRQGLRLHTKKSISKDDLSIYNPDYGWLIFKNNAGNTVVPSFTDVQIEAGMVMTDYEAPVPYQTLPLSTPNGLPGVPVTSGGNYTDADGQQWICDEVDLARGVYVQRIKRIAINESSTINSTNRFSTGGLSVVQPFRVGGVVYGKIKKDCPIKCDKLENVRVWNKAVEGCYAVEETIDFTIFNSRLGTSETTSEDDAVAALKLWLADNPIEFIAVMKNPIETPIPEDELAAYAALHTNKPNTTIYNDAGAHMDVEYVADTKLYIDQKINELATAIVSST